MGPPIVLALKSGFVSLILIKKSLSSRSFLEMKLYSWTVVRQRGLKLASKKFVGLKEFRVCLVSGSTSCRAGTLANELLRFFQKEPTRLKVFIELLEGQVFMHLQGCMVVFK